MFFVVGLLCFAYVQDMSSSSDLG